MADPNPPSPLVPHATILITGPVLVCALLSYLLLGVLIVQLYIYYMSFKNDGFYVKFTVYLVCIMDLASTIAITEATWLMIIEGWGRPENLHLVDWGFSTIPFWNATSSAIVQYFFAYRVWKLGSQHASERLIWQVVVGVIVVVSTVQMIGGIISTALFAPLNDILKIDICFPSTATWLSGSAAADVLITGSMTVLLRRAMSGTSRKDEVSSSAHARHTDALITRLIRNTIETAAVTATAAILELIFFLRLPFSGVHVGIAIVLSKLYSNTLLASLNSRLPLLREGPPSSQVASYTSATGISRFESEHIGSNRLSYRSGEEALGYSKQSTELTHAPTYGSHLMASGPGYGSPAISPVSDTPPRNDFQMRPLRRSDQDMV